MAQIPLSRGQYALIDDADLELVSRYTWHASPRHYGGGFTACSGRGGSNPSRSGLIKMQNLLMPPPEGMIVDHANRNPLDNRRRNLRFATPSLNTVNRKYRNKTGFRGVAENDGKFIARIWVDKKKRYLGNFATAELAALAYDKAAIAAFGEFALLNFPDLEVDE